MSGIIREADANTLLLIDEFGTGSDPELGGALAESFMEFFYDKRVSPSLRRTIPILNW